MLNTDFVLHVVLECHSRPGPNDNAIPVPTGGWRQSAVRIAIVGTGISGLTCAELLRRRHDVTVFEAQGRAGGHANTVTVVLSDTTAAVDTGFLVYTEQAYPLLTRLFSRLGTPTQPADMSFSVRDEQTGTEWRGTSPATVFAQPANALRVDFWRMLADIGRFNRSARSLLASSHRGQPGPTLAQFVEHGRWSKAFVDGYLIPIGSAIWSANPATFTDMPAVTFAAFFARHGLLRFGSQASWRTVSGGSRRYVHAIVDPLRRQGRLHLLTPVSKIRRTEHQVELLTSAGPASFDHVVVAAHSDEALALLADADRHERTILGALRYQANRAVLHTDASLLPKATRARAAWNYHRLADQPTVATLTYDITRLQSLATRTPVLVTLNRDEAIDPDCILDRFDYAHPVVDTAAVAARDQWATINGRRRTSFCGAYWGDGFHEDGVRSAVAACAPLGADPL